MISVPTEKGELMATEKRLIDANDVKREIWNMDCDVYEFCEGCVTNMGISRVELDDAIDRVPTVDAVEVVHGRFEFACVHNGKKHYKCTNCHHAFPFANVNYCPNCGAKMDLEDKE
jgi:hypothetical protein